VAGAELWVRLQGIDRLKVGQRSRV